MSWENLYQTTPSLLEAGFNIVNSSWIPMYIVTPVAYWTQEEAFNWNTRTWGALHPASPYHDKKLTVQDSPQIIGGQLLAWGDVIMEKYPNLEDGLSEERELVSQRAPMLAENTWNKEKIRDYADILEAYRETDRIRKELIK